MDKLVSIVLPIYNGQKYMRESIESIINQTYKNWELLILDDCSSDSTSIIAKEYVLQDSRIKYYRNEQNLKLPRNLNKGFALSNGEYLTWTSDDNLYKSNAIEKMINVLELTGKQFVYASCRIIDSNGKEIEYIMVDEKNKKSIVGGNPVGACFLYTREVYENIGDYNPDYVLVEDLDYWQRICSKYEPACISEILYYYRLHDEALTSTMKQDEFNKNLENVLKKNKSLFGKLDLDQKYYFYNGLFTCEKKLHSKVNYIMNVKYYIYNTIYLVRRRVPNKIKRYLQKYISSIKRR